MKKAIFILLFFVLLYTRVVGIGWGLPYPMHPDERNMADAVTQITLLKPYSPSFWSYGGFQINIAHFFLVAKHTLGRVHTPIAFLESIIMLRLISAFFSIISALYIVRIIKKYTRNKEILFATYLVATFSPALIQMAHFGTTESALTFFLIALTYYSLDLTVSKEKRSNLTTYVIIGILLGMAIATKVTAVFFIVGPMFAFMTHLLSHKKATFVSRIRNTGIFLITLGLSTGLTAILFSPHYLLYFKEFSGSLLYERSLVTGVIDVFYTRQFFESIPLLFQMKHVFPYMLGVPIFIFSLCGFFLLPWKDAKYNLLRIVLLAYFLPTAFLYTKWARYQTPVIPLLTIFAMLFFTALFYKSRNTVLFFCVSILIIPGLAYLSIYIQPDVRFVASRWIYQHIPTGSTILSETANVIDIPVQFTADTTIFKNYNVTQFDFYNVDTDSLLQQKLPQEINSADYIIIPSRRVFMNHTCLDKYEVLSIKNEGLRCEKLKKKYPILNNYYESLFEGKLGFKEVEHITAYPRLALFGKTIIEFPDEQAEETWTVFDHPTIRIFKRI